MEQLNKNDLELIKELSSRKYTGLSLASNSTIAEQIHFKEIKNKLRDIASYFCKKYNGSYGPFETSVSSGNPITRGNSLNNVWAGIFKGALNKQYAAQISFVINRNKTCLDVGFYFGRASGHNLTNEKRLEFETILNNLGICLSKNIFSNSELQNKFESLLDYGFAAYSDGKYLNAIDWAISIKTNAKSSQVTVSIHPNDFGIIDNSLIDFYISQIIFLMGAIHTDFQKNNSVIKPLTPEQSAKRAELLAKIGIKGELYVFQQEQEKLQLNNIKKHGFPKHVALESTHYGYDILSLDENQNDLYIEVKTTTRSKNDKASKKFFISKNEFEVYQRNQGKYKLFRVYDIENNPSYEEIDLNNVAKSPDGFIIEYQ